MKNKFITTTFLVIIFGVLLFLPINFVLIKLDKITLSYDNFKSFTPKAGNGLLTKFDNKFSSLRVSLENRVTNYFPFYSSINYNFSNINYNLNKPIYKHDDFTFISTNSDNEYVYYNNDFFIVKSRLNSNELREKFDKQIDFYKSMASEDVNLYIYLPNRYEFTGLKDNLKLRDYDSYLTALNSLQESNIKVDSLKTNSIDDYNRYFYKTDHHWNAYGAYQGYVDISSMMGIEPKQVDIVTTNKKYRGSIAKESAYINNYDYFSYIDFKKDYDCLVNGKINPKHKPKVIEETNNNFYDYYVNYYNGYYAMVEYTFNNSDRNLLIIGDSYAWQIDDLLASSFNKTYIINIRCDEFANKSLNFAKFVKEKGITDVLVLVQSNNALFDSYDYDFSGKVLGE